MCWRIELGDDAVVLAKGKHKLRVKFCNLESRFSPDSVSSPDLSIKGASG